MEENSGIKIKAYMIYSIVMLPHDWDIRLFRSVCDKENYCIY